jgi:4-hydroxy-4-methyl-2-oxoglutarate aldolase
MEKVVKDPLRASAEELKLISGMQTALLHEAMGKCGNLASDIKPVYPGAGFAGTALTVKSFPGDNLMLHQAIAIARPGDVLVVSVDGFTEAGHWGEIAAEAAMQKGIVGLVIDGGIRDVEPISRLGFPVFARGICIKGTTKKHAGLLNNPLVIGGQLVNPGDIVVGDTDGVVVVPRADVRDVHKKALAIVEREDGWLKEIRKGALTVDLLNLRPVLRELGME